METYIQINKKYSSYNLMLVISCHLQREYNINLAHFVFNQRASSGSRKGSGRTGSANMPTTGGSRNGSAGSGK